MIGPGGAACSGWMWVAVAIVQDQGLTFEFHWSASRLSGFRDLASNFLARFNVNRIPISLRPFPQAEDNSWDDTCTLILSDCLLLLRQDWAGWRLLQNPCSSIVSTRKANHHDVRSPCRLHETATLTVDLMAHLRLRRSASDFPTSPPRSIFRSKVMPTMKLSKSTLRIW